MDIGVLLSQLVEPLPELHEHRVGEVAGDAGGDLLLNVLDADVLQAPARHQVLNGGRVQDDPLGGLRDLHLNVFADQVNGLAAKGMPSQAPGDVRGPDGLVDVREPPVVITVEAQLRVRTERLP